MDILYHDILTSFIMVRTSLWKEHNPSFSGSEEWIQIRFIVVVWYVTKNKEIIALEQNK